MRPLGSFSTTINHWTLLRCRCQKDSLWALLYLENIIKICIFSLMPFAANEFLSVKKVLISGDDLLHDITSSSMTSLQLWFCEEGTLLSVGRTKLEASTLPAIKIKVCAANSSLCKSSVSWHKSNKFTTSSIGKNQSGSIMHKKVWWGCGLYCHPHFW